MYTNHPRSLELLCLSVLPFIPPLVFNSTTNNHHDRHSPRTPRRHGYTDDAPAPARASMAARAAPATHVVERVEVSPAADRCRTFPRPVFPRSLLPSGARTALALPQRPFLTPLRKSLELASTCTPQWLTEGTKCAVRHKRLSQASSLARSRRARVWTVCRTRALRICEWSSATMV